MMRILAGVLEAALIIASAVSGLAALLGTPAHAVSSYTTCLSLQQPATGDQTNSWGTTVNTNWSIVDQALAGNLSIALPSQPGYPTVALGFTQGATDQAKSARFTFTGTLTANTTVLWPNGRCGRFVVNNTTSGSFSITLCVNNGGGGCAGGSVVIPQGQIAAFYDDGTNISAETNTSTGSNIGQLHEQVFTSSGTFTTPQGTTTATVFKFTVVGGGAEVNQAQGSALPYLNAAQSYLGAGGSPVFPNVMQWSPSTLAQFQNPYTAQVTGATQNLFNEQNAEQFNQANAAAAAAGAFGGDRESVLEGQMAQQQQLAEDPTLAGIQSQGFTTAAGLLGQQQNLQLQGMEGDAWRAANAAGTEAALGNEAQTSLLGGASSELQAGALQQQLQQEQLELPEAQFEQQQAYPFQSTNFLAGLTEGVGGGMGGTGATTTPGPSVLGQVAGLGMTGLGLYNEFSGGGLGYGAGDAAAASYGLGAGADETSLLDNALNANRGGRIRFPSVRRAVGGFTPNFGAPGLPSVAGLSAGDMADVNSAVAMAGASPVSVMPGGGRGLPFSAPQSVQNTSGGGGDSTLQTIAQIAGIAAMVFSDPALKERRGPARDALAALRGMQVDRARYKWEGPERERPMLMADSVARAAPHAVAGAAPTRAVNSLELIPLLVQGVKELDRRTGRASGGVVQDHYRRGFPRARADGGDATPELGGDGLDNFLIRTGAAMMASRSPFFLTQLGDGLQAGLSARPSAAAPHVDESGRFFRLVYPGARSFGSRLPNINGPYRAPY